MKTLRWTMACVVVLSMLLLAACQKAPSGKEIAGLVNEENYELAVQRLQASGKPLSEPDKALVLSMLVRNVQLYEIKEVGDLTYEQMDRYRDFKALADALQLDASTKQYDIVRYINTALEFSEYEDYFDLYRLVYSGDLSQFTKVFSEAGEYLTDPSSERKYQAAMTRLESIDMSSYNPNAFGIEIITAVHRDMLEGMPMIYEGLQTRNMQLASDGAEICMQNMNDFIDLTETAKYHADEIGKIHDRLKLLSPFD